VSITPTRGEAVRGASVQAIVDDFHWVKAVAAVCPALQAEPRQWLTDQAPEASTIPPGSAWNHRLMSSSLGKWVPAECVPPATPAMVRVRWGWLESWWSAMNDP